MDSVLGFDPAHSVETIHKILFSFVFYAMLFCWTHLYANRIYNDLNILIYKKLLDRRIAFLSMQFIFYVM